MSPRAARALAAVIASAFLGYWCLLVYCDVWRPVTPGITASFDASGRMTLIDVTAGSPWDLAGLRRGDRILAIDGHSVAGRLDWMAIEANLEINRPQVFTYEREGRVSTAAVSRSLASWKAWRSQDGPLLLLIRCMQLASLLVGVLVAIKRPTDPAALLGAIFLATIGVFSVTLPYRLAAVWRSLPAALGLLLWIPFTASMAIAAWAYAFFAVFPRVTFRSPLIWSAIWVPILPGVLGYSWFAYQMVIRGRPDSTTFPYWPQLLLLSSGLYLAAVLIRIVRSYRNAVDVTDRRRLRVLMIGILMGAVGGVPVLLSYWHGATTNLTRSFLASPLALPGTFLFLLLPLSFAYAILRHKLFDIRLIIRQGVRYALARRALLALVPLLAAILLLDAIAHADQPIGELVRGRVWLYGSLAAFDALDHRFFRERYSAQRVLRQVVEDIRQASRLVTIAPMVVSRVDQALHPTCVALLAREKEENRYRALAASPVNAEPSQLDAGNKVLALTRLLGRPVDVGSEAAWLARKMPIADLQAVRATGIELLVPIAGKGKDEADALLVLGPRRSDEPYTEDDGELLMAVADSIALRLPQVEPVPAAETASFSECPACGACYDAGTTKCATEGRTLVPIQVPRVIAGRYRVDRRMGRGGMGTVYAAFDEALERRVAVKLIRPDLIGNPLAAERFHREARTAAAFAHPNVVTVHDFGVTGANAFLVMELLEGQSLFEAMRSEPRLERRRCLAILRDVTNAIDTAHRRQLVHRDLKPENVFLVRREGGETAKVLDFGIAKLLASDDLEVRTTPATNGSPVGTPLYMAPEQLRGEEPSPAWDVWALAVIAIEMLAGFHPFASIATSGIAVLQAGGLPHQTNLPDPCRQLFGRALSVNPADRPPSAREFFELLERSLPG